MASSSTQSVADSRHRLQPTPWSGKQTHLYHRMNASSSSRFDNAEVCMYLPWLLMFGSHDAACLHSRGALRLHGRASAHAHCAASPCMLLHPMVHLPHITESPIALPKNDGFAHGTMTASLACRMPTGAPQRAAHRWPQAPGASQARTGGEGTAGRACQSGHGSVWVHGPWIVAAATAGPHCC